MVRTKRYVLRIFVSLKHITANIVDRQTGRIAASASTVEAALKSAAELGRTTNAKSAAAVGEVLAMRLRVQGFSSAAASASASTSSDGAGGPIHADVTKALERKGFKNRTKVWAIVNALRSHGVPLVVDDDDDPADPL
ncbi:hypothetical protein QJS10_CPB21g00324 [Acorus calamus]|uniref:Uncharacterized protein n=1 Tax=Acorus calamus TaxID=4465 RepID=A0AAV9C6U7_ACOCL|nr:hypothetical protein QJS10_CPB21g00324 [Acorus calamus]